MPNFHELLNFIRVAHAGQQDKGAGQPYWLHPVSVLENLPPFASEELRQATMLHDVLEDTAFVRDGETLTLDSTKFSELPPEMRRAKRALEMQIAEEEGNPDWEFTPEITTITGLSPHALNIVEAVTNEPFDLPHDVSKEETESLKRAHYHEHVLALAHHRPLEAEAAKLAEDIVLLKFADMSKNLEKERVQEITDPARSAWYAKKYAKPYKALLARAGEIARQHGYELHAEPVQEFDDEGKLARFYLKAQPEWVEKRKDIAQPKSWVADVRRNAQSNNGLPDF